MTLEDFLTRLNYALRGTDDDVPTIGDDEATYWVNTLNRVKDSFYRNVGIRWAESWQLTRPNEPGTVTTAGTTTLTGTGTYFTDYRVGDRITVSGETVRTIATITSNTSLTVTVAFSTTASALTFARTVIIGTAVQDYSMHRSLIALSDDVSVTKTDTNIEYFDLQKPEERDSVVGKVYLHGIHPQTLTFTADIESTDDIVGGTLNEPGYYMPADVSVAADLIPLPDANWGIMQTAAELAFADITYEDKSADLNAKANSLYRQLVRANKRGSYNNPRITPTNVKRIRGY